MRRTTLAQAAVLAATLGASACSDGGPEPVAPGPASPAPGATTGAPVARGQRAATRVDPTNPHSPGWFKSGPEDGFGEPNLPSVEWLVDIGPGVEADLLPEERVPARPRRRMNLDQLAGAMVQASGGFGWTERRGNTEVDLFAELSATLGKPDFIQITTEDLDPSALFQKFLDDAARSVCAKMVDHDVNQVGAREERVLMRHVGFETTRQSDPAAVDENLRWLLARVHTRRVEPDSPALAGWRWQFDGLIFSGATPPEAWNAVCVALFTHPDFYTY